MSCDPLPLAAERPPAASQEPPLPARPLGPREALGQVSSIHVSPKRDTVVPTYRIATWLSGMIQDGESFATRSSFAKTEALSKQQLFVVCRTLDQLSWFKSQFLQKEPYCVLSPLPQEENWRSYAACDSVLSLIIFMISSRAAAADPLLWSLLTAKDEDFAAQAESEKGKDLKLSSEHVRKLQKMASSDERTALQKVAKPTIVSPQMLETTMSDRAFVSLDKIALCVDAAQEFHRRREARPPGLLGTWKRVYEESCKTRFDSEALHEASTAVAQSFRELAETNVWPWEGAVDPATPYRQAIDYDSARLKLPTMRLSRFMQRTSLNVQELGRRDGEVMTEAFHQVCALMALNQFALQRSLLFADAALNNSDQCLRLLSLQQEVVQLIEQGQGFAELPKLEKVDEEVSKIHDYVDESLTAFENCAIDVKAGVSERWTCQTREYIIQQKVGWEATSVLLTDLKNALDNDTFLDEEPLPIVAHLVEEAEATLNSPVSVAESIKATLAAGVAAVSEVWQALRPKHNVRRAAGTKGGNPFDINAQLEDDDEAPSDRIKGEEADPAPPVEMEMRPMAWSDVQKLENDDPYGI